MVKPLLTRPQVLETLGRNIFIFNNIKTNQTVYSLTRTLKNNDALKQCFFMGPGSVPRALRKDLWTPLLSVHLPDQKLGLKIFHHLRELKMLHLTQWKDEEILKTNMNDRRKALMNQKANSIADLAAALEHEVSKHTELEPKSIVIRWQEPYDSEFAASWPEAVVYHDKAARGRHTSAAPTPELKRTWREILGIPEPEPEPELELEAKPPVRRRRFEILAEQAEKAAAEQAATAAEKEALRKAAAEKAAVRKAARRALKEAAVEPPKANVEEARP